MEQNDKPSQTNLLFLQILLGFAATVIAAYLGYLGVRATVETPIHATQTAEARITPIIPSATTIATEPAIPTIEIKVQVITETPTHIPPNQPTPTVITPASSLIISLPRAIDLSSSPSIWSLVNESSPTSPATLTYNASVLANSQYQWGAIWCGKNLQTLQAILKPLTMALLINDKFVESSKILEFDEVISGWSCHKWRTIISGWQPNTTTKLELSYFLSETIFDGASYTQKGEYHIIVFVTSQ